MSIFYFDVHFYRQISFQSSFRTFYNNVIVLFNFNCYTSRNNYRQSSNT